MRNQYNYTSQYPSFQYSSTPFIKAPLTKPVSKNHMISFGFMFKKEWYQYKIFTILFHKRKYYNNIHRKQRLFLWVQKI